MNWNTLFIYSRKFVFVKHLCTSQKDGDVSSTAVLIASQDDTYEKFEKYL
jgi:hypothetical protein